MFLEIHRAIFDLNSFALEQFSLQGGIRFADEQPPACAHDAVPRNASPARTCAHGVPSGSRAATQSKRPRNLPVGDYAPSRNSFHQAVYLIPEHSRFPVPF